MGMHFTVCALAQKRFLHEALPYFYEELLFFLLEGKP